MQRARSLHRDGFAIVDFGFDAELIAKARDFTASTIGDARRVQDGWLVNVAVNGLATNPAVLSLLGKLFGHRAFPFQTLNFKYGTEQRTHPDTYHFNSVPERFMCGVWVVPLLCWRSQATGLSKA